MKNKLDLYAVMGNPIAHSKSHFIHSEFAKQTQQSLQYIAIEVPIDNFKNAVLDFQQRGGKGLNITVPFKREAWELATERSARAQLAGAVNTIVFRDNGKIVGDNTDGIGLIRDLTQNLHYALTNKRILILGAGGATQGVIAPLLAEKPQQFVIANRTVEKALQLAEQFSSLGNIHGCGFDDLNAPFDLIINATSASLKNELPPITEKLLMPATWCYDMAYGKNLTVFLQWAKNHYVKNFYDGLGMLVEQAAESFFLWRGVKPKTEPVIRMLRE